MYMYSVFFKKTFSGGQTNILRNRGGRRLQLKYIKLKWAKAQGGGGGGARPFSGGGGNAPPQTL